MKLTDLHAQIADAGGEGIYQADMTPAPRRIGVGLYLDCPCGCGKMHVLHFQNPIDGGAHYADRGQTTWVRTGTTLEALTLRPSILFDPVKGGCGWHGFITNGEVTTA